MLSQLSRDPFPMLPITRGKRNAVHALTNNLLRIVAVSAANSGDFPLVLVARIFGLEPAKDHDIRPSLFWHPRHIRLFFRLGCCAQQEGGREQGATSDSVWRGQ